MKPIKWNMINDLAGWKSTLADLLDQASKASGKNDDDELLEIAGALNTFVTKSFPNTPDISALDAMALDAVQAMTESIAAEAVARIAARTMTLTALQKEVDQITQRAEESASAIRLEKAHAAVDAMTDAMRAIDGLDDVFVDGTDDQLRERVKALLTDLKKARDLLEKKAKLP